MRPLNVKLLCCISLLFGLAVFAGCGGSSDPLDEMGYRYQILTAAPSDRNETTSDIDLWHDCDDDLANGDDGEDLLTKASVTLTFKSNTEQSDIWVYRVRIDYSLIEWSYGEEAGPPDGTPYLASNSFDADIFIPGNGGSGSGEIDLLSTVDKGVYRTILGQDNAGLQTDAIFQVTVTAYLTYSPDSPENDIEIRKKFTINVGNFVHSSCSAEEEET